MEATDRNTRRSPRATLPAGVSPAARGFEKRQQALSWLRQWHYSTNDMVCKLIGISDSGYLAKLQHRGLVERVSAPTLPARCVYVLTAAGLMETLAESDDLSPYPREPSRLNHSLLRHQLAVQRTILNLDGLRQSVPERLLAASGKAGDKYPDALVKTDKTAPHHAAVEVELTPKYGRELDQAMLAHLAALRRGDYGFVIYTSPSQALLERYRLHLDKPVQQWERDPSARKWKPTKRVAAPPELVSRFVFVVAPDLLKGL